MIDKNAAYEAVEKNSYLLVTLLSSKVVGLIDFGQELVANEFMTQSALNDIYDEPSTSRKAADLSLNITNQEFLRREVKPRTKQELLDGIESFWLTVDVEKCQKYIRHLRKVKLNAEKYYKAFIDVLEKCPALETVLKSITQHYELQKTSHRIQVDQAEEGRTSFNCYTHYYSSHFLLRLKLSLDDQLVEVKEQAVSKDAFIQLDDVTLDLDKLALEMEQVLFPYGIRRVLRAHHDEQLPIYELHFTSEYTVQLFLKEKEEADRKLEKAISHLVTSNTTTPSLDLQMSTHLYFMIPQNGAQETQLQLVTDGNCKEITSKYRETLKMKLESDLFKACSAVELTADEVLKELDGVAEWFLFGIYLRVPLSEMKKSKCSKKDIIHTWLQMDQALHTWQKIVDALVGAEQTEIAHRIAAKYDVTVPDPANVKFPLAVIQKESEEESKILQDKEKDIQLEKIQISRERKKAAQFGRDLVEATESFKRQKKEIVSTAEELKQKESELEYLNGLLQGKEKHNKSLIALVEAKEREISDLKKKIASSDPDNLQKIESDDIENDLKQKETELCYLKEVFDGQEEQSQPLKIMIEEKEREVDDLKNKATKSEVNLKQKKEEISQLREEIIKSSNEQHRKQERMIALQEERAAIISENRKPIIEQEVLLRKTFEYQFPVVGDATKEREVEEYQQKVKEKEEKISDLTEKLQAQETVITQLKEQANSQPTEPTDSLDEPVEPTDSLDEAVIEMMEMTRELADAKSEKQKAYRHMLDARQRINFASDPNLCDTGYALLLMEADTSKCVAEGPGISSAEINSTTTFTVSVKDHHNNPCKHPHRLTTTLHSLVDDSIAEIKQISKDDATYEVLYTAAQRGRHQLSVAVNGVEIQRSPFDVFIKVPPTQLNEPVHTIEELNSPYCIAITSNFELIVSECMSYKVSIRTRNGKKKKDFGTMGSREFKHPCGVAVDNSDYCIFVADCEKHCIQKFSPQGQCVKLVGKKGSGCLEFNNPYGLKLNNKKLYVCDTRNYRIQVFDTELNYITSIGGVKGSGPGEFNGSFDLSFDNCSMLHITDKHNHRVQVFDECGKYVRQYGQTGNEPAYMYIHVDRDFVYVSEQNSQCVYVFTTVSGEFVCTVGSGPGVLRLPCGVAVDADGFVYVCDRYNNCVQIF